MTEPTPPVLLLGSGAAEVAALAAALPAELSVVPDVASGSASAGVDWAWAGGLEEWRRAASGGAPAERIVVAVWPADLGPPVELADTPLDEWIGRAEVGFARWFAALGVAARRCGDGGAIVAAVERPAPLDCAGWAPETGGADAVEAMVRSLARSEGPRGVRVNAVTTPVRSTRPPVVDPAPSLATFPGRVDHEVAGAVRMLLGGDAAGVTGTVVHADCGRSWR
jgi:NAD(P)-dependent dehydrogenase (short-subunit alcohol dehydrogenase family)